MNKPATPGDGLMMTWFYTQAPKASVETDGTLAVFDGMNSPADKIQEISEKINEGVNHTWEQNVARPVYDGFANFLKLKPAVDKNDDSE